MKHSIILSFLFPFFFLFVAEKSFSQDKKIIDSLETVLKTTATDTQKVKCLQELGFLYQYSDPSKGLEYARQGSLLAEQKGLAYWQAKCLGAQGQNYEKIGNYQKAIEIQKKSLGIYETLKDEKGKSNAYNNLGQVYSYKGDYPKAIDSHIKALAIREKLGDKELISASITNIGTTYYFMEDYSKSLNYFQKSLAIDEERGDKAGVSKLLNNIGVIYENQEKYDVALDNYKESFVLKQKVGDQLGASTTQANIGNVYLAQKDYGNALHYFQSSIQLKREINNKGGIIAPMHAIGKMYSNQGMYEKGIAYTDSALSLAKEIGAKKNIQESYEQMADIYSAMKNFEKAYEYKTLYSQMKDSLLDEEKTKQISELSTIYETDKKEKQIEIQNLQITAQDAELNEKQITIYASIGGLLLMLLLAVFIYRSYRQKQKANILLGEKNELIEKQKGIVEEKNKDITASIRYAERIQRAILPADSILQKALPNSFVYYAPRDIVSGDFYWLHLHNGCVFIAACDCTGHGVPGALMSMIGKDQLNHVVVEKNILSTSEILSHLSRGIKNALQQGVQDESVQDGMEIALLKINTDKKEVSFSGANRPLFLVRESGAEEILLDKFPIGGHTEQDYIFKSQNIQTNDSDMLYIFSDGYADQFGGEKGKKFTTKKLKDLLIGIAPMTVSEQSRELKKTFENWKGNLEQVDDVLVIGIRASLKSLR